MEADRLAQIGALRDRLGDVLKRYKGLLNLTGAQSRGEDIGMTTEEWMNRLDECEIQCETIKRSLNRLGVDGG